MSKLLMIFSFLLLPWMTAAWEIRPPDEEMYRAIGIEYGTEAEHRFRQLHNLLSSAKQWSQVEKLSSVNDFFNGVTWRDDMSHWGQKDYWQTPLETLTSFEGDCEDIAIAKYTALRTLGFSDDELAITYVTINRPPEYPKVPHMVLGYYQTSFAEPLVLDSIDRVIKSASGRSDLTSVYEFNTTTLWLTDHHLHKLGKHWNSSRLVLENELKERLRNNRKHLIKLNGGIPFFPFELDTL